MKWKKLSTVEALRLCGYSRLVCPHIAKPLGFGLLTINLIKMEIEKQIDDLTFERWRFTFMYGAIFLDGYCLLQKENKRKRTFKVLKQYERIMGRGNNITETEVPFTDELKAEALNQFVSTIKVRKWSER
jgi:hypothetical protein